MLDFGDPARRRILIAAGVALVALGAFGWFGYQAYEETSAVRAETETLRSQVQTADREIRTIPGIEENVLVLRERVKRYAEILPDDAEINSFVDQLAEFARDASVSIRKLDDTAAKRRTKGRRGQKAEAVDRIVYKLEISASGPALMRFFDLLENHYERFVRIKSLSVEAQSDFLKLAAESEKALTARHTINLEIETGVYNQKRAGEQVKIPDEERILERLASSGRLSEIEDVLAIERYAYDAELARRDIFVDPRLARAAEQRRREGAREQADKQMKLFADQLDELREAVSSEAKIEDRIARLQASVNTTRALGALRQQVMEARASDPFVLGQAQSELDTGILEPVNALLTARGGGRNVAAERLRKEIRTLRSRVERLVNAEKWADLERFASDSESLLAWGMADSESEPDVAWISEQRTLGILQREFASLELKVGGLIVFPGDAGQRVVILNGRSLVPGEAVAGLEGLRLVTIETDELVFDFRGHQVAKRIQ